MFSELPSAQEGFCSHLKDQGSLNTSSAFKNPEVVIELCQDLKFFWKNWFTSDKVLWRRHVYPDVTERRIPCLQTTVVLFEKKPIKPQNQPRCPTAALLTACEKPTRETFWKYCNLLLLEDYSLCFCQENLAGLGCTSPSCAGPEPEKEVGTRQPRWSLPHDPRAGTVWGHQPQKADGSTGLEGCVSFCSPSATHHITAGMEPSLSACSAPSEQGRQCSLPTCAVVWTRIFHFICGECNHFLLCWTRSSRLQRDNKEITQAMSGSGSLSLGSVWGG